MSEQKVIVPTAEVQGDITSCKIENQLVSRYRESPFSLTQTSSYVSYNVCTKEIMDRYTVPEMTSIFPGLLVFLIVLVLGWKMFSW